MERRQFVALLPCLCAGHVDGLREPRVLYETSGWGGTYPAQRGKYYQCIRERDAHTVIIDGHIEYASGEVVKTGPRIVELTDVAIIDDDGTVRF